MIKLSAALLALMITPALAQGMPCGPAAQVVASITAGEKYHELLALEGTTESNAQLEVYWDQAGLTLSVLIYPRPGIACIIAAGKNMVPAAPQPKKPVKGERGS